MYSIEELQHWVDKGLTSLPFDKEPRELYHPVIYALSVGGKRLRPVMCLLTCQLFNEHIGDQVLLPALGLELFHAFTLAHDDIMDGAEIRRGQPTLHHKWNTHTAILSGDVMCIYACSLVSQCAPAVLPQVLNSFSRTAAMVCEGQQYDISYEAQALITHQEYLQMIALKTAALIACAAQIGAFCGGAIPIQAQYLYDFGHATGMGFQIRDDYLDAFGDRAIFGKSIGGDILNNKKTWLLVDALQKAKGTDLQELNHWLTLQEASQEKVAGIIRLYQKLDIPQAAEAEINRYYAASIQALDRVAIPDHKKEQLYRYVLSLLKREK